MWNLAGNGTWDYNLELNHGDLGKEGAWLYIDPNRNIVLRIRGTEMFYQRCPEGYDSWSEDVYKAYALSLVQDWARRVALRPSTDLGFEGRSSPHDCTKEPWTFRCGIEVLFQDGYAISLGTKYIPPSFGGNIMLRIPAREIPVWKLHAANDFPGGAALLVEPIPHSVARSDYQVYAIEQAAKHFQRMALRLRLHSSIVVAHEVEPGSTGPG